MKILDRYIRRAVLMGTSVAIFVLLPLVGFLLLADELDNVGTGHYTLRDAFAFIALSLPRYAYQIFPIAVLIGGLLGLGSLAAHSELTAMRAAGISLARIVGAVLKAGGVAALTAVLLGDVVAPYAEEKGNQLRAEAMSEQIALKSRYGFWTRDGNAFINIRQVLPGGRLQDVYIYEFDEARRLQLSSHAAAAEYEGSQWRLTDIKQSAITEEGVTARTLEQATWSSLIDPAMLSLLIVDPHILPSWGLYRYIDFMQDNGLNASAYQVVFWSKMAMPLVILVMVFLAVPLLFGTLRSVGIGQRVFIGVLIGIAFYIVNKGFSQLAVVYALNPLLAAVAPGLLCFAVAIWVLRKVR